MLCGRVPTRQKRGFTLLEMLICLSLTGILAVTVLGIMQNQASAARRVATADTVRQTVQAISMFREQTGVLPDLLTGWDPIIRPTVVNGQTVGPFVTSVPRNLMIPGRANASCIADGNVPILYLTQCAFLYDYAGGSGSGRFIASYDLPPDGGLLSLSAIGAIGD